MILPHLFAATLAIQGATPTFNSHRTLKFGQNSDYTVHFTMTSMGMGGKASIHEQVLKPVDDVSAVIQSITKFDPEGNATYEKPQALASEVSGHNLPDSLTMTKGQIDFLYVFLATAELTADKKLAVGDEFAIDWHSRKGELALKGTGKLVSLDDKTAKVAIDLNMTFDGNPFGEFKWTSLFNSANAALQTAEGTWNLQGLQYTLSVAKANVPAPTGGSL
jgi:hypothetical protein